MSRRAALAALGLVGALGCAGDVPETPARPTALAAETARHEGAADVEAVASVLAARLAAPAPQAAGEPVRERDALAAFYGGRGFRPVWEALPTPRREALLGAVRAARGHGLRPGLYHEAALAAAGAEERAAPQADARRRAEVELLRSDAFLHLARHLSAGALDPQAFHPGYARREGPPDPRDALREVVEGGAAEAVLAEQAPPHPEYAALMAGLARLRALEAAGGWPALPGGPKLEAGDRDPRVLALRARLAWPAPPPAPAEGDPERFDAALAQALRRAQRRHGLEPDGVLGAETTRALSVPVADRIAQVRANLERWRWQPRRFGARSLRVDLAAFRLRAMAGGEVQHRMRVVVGSREWPTPPLHSAVTHLVLNPRWDVPRSIAVGEMLPRILEEPGYLEEQGIEVLRLQDDGGWLRVDSMAVDWGTLDADFFPYRLRQPPGGANPMGRAKFVFPSSYGVFLHGTPARGALKRPHRALSHGCVRVEDELLLAAWALAPGGAWSRERVAQALDRAREAGASPELRLPEPLPVHLVYFTAAAGSDGALRFHADPYGWDPPVAAALDGAQARPSAPAPAPAPRPGDAAACAASPPAGTASASVRPRS